MERAIIELSKVPERGAAVADFFGRPVLVTKVDGRPRVFLDSCSHFGGPLERRGDALVCGWHSAEFGLDGRCQRGPARAESRVIVLPTKVVDGVVTYTYTPPEGTPGAHEDDRHVIARLGGDHG